MLQSNETSQRKGIRIKTEAGRGSAGKEGLRAAENDDSDLHPGADENARGVAGDGPCGLADPEAAHRRGIHGAPGKACGAEAEAPRREAAIRGGAQAPLSVARDGVPLSTGSPTPPEGARDG